MGELCKSVAESNKDQKRSFAHNRNPTELTTRESTMQSIRAAQRITRLTTRAYTNWPFLKEEHVMLAETCRSFARQELPLSMAQKIDKEHFFPTEQVKKLGELGLMGVCVSPDYGGSGMDSVSYSIAMEEISRACASTGVIMSANNSLYCGPVEKYATHEQKEKFLQPW